jgi:hypothetical protein
MNVWRIGLGEEKNQRSIEGRRHGLFWISDRDGDLRKKKMRGENLCRSLIRLERGPEK